MLRTLSNFAYGTYIGPIYYSSRSIGLESMKKRDWNKFESAVGAWRRLELGLGVGTGLGARKLRIPVRHPMIAIRKGPNPNPHFFAMASRPQQWRIQDLSKGRRTMVSSPRA